MEVRNRDGTSLESGIWYGFDKLTKSGIKKSYFVIRKSKVVSRTS